MAKIERHGRRGYALGCRCDQCKCEESSYQRELRQRKAGLASPGLAVIQGGNSKPLTSGNAQQTPANPSFGSANSRVEATQAEIDALGGEVRPGLAAAAISLAEVLDDPRALSTRPAAAAKLADLLEQMRKSSSGRKSKLAAVRSMTKTG